MLFENIINIFTLIATIVGLLGCLFKYIKSPKRGYLYLIVFFLSSFFSDYYWTIYTLVMNSYPEVSEFLAYLGWNVEYVFLMLAVIRMRKDGAKRYFHPVMLIPVVANIAQLVLYMQFGGIFNNIWQVSFTTAAMVFCVQDIAYYVKNKKSGAQKPHLSVIVLIYLIFAYGMWTSSCFDWPGDLLSPYIYCAAVCAVCTVLFARNAGADYDTEPADERGSGWMEYRFQMLFQAIASVVIFIACGAGYIIAVKIKEYIPDTGEGTAASDSIIRTLFIISIVLILIVLLMVREIRRYYQTARKKQQEMDEGKRSRINFLFTMAITLALMVFIVFYNSRTLYNASVTGIYEDGDDVVVSTATEIENYMIIAETTLRVTADTVDTMEKNGSSSGEVLQYLTDQTNRRFEQFDNSFTGIYAYFNGQFMDGSGWSAPDDYDPVSREWYSDAVKANGEIVIVSPYIDAQTGSVVITFAKCISSENNSDPSSQNVVALDIIVNHIQSVTEKVEIAGKGYAMVVNADGFIVAHKNTEYIGQNVADIYGTDNYEKIVRSGENRVKTVIDGETCELFVHSVLEQWTAVIVVGNTELYENVYSQLAVNILISLMTFLLISYFYYFGYRIEQNNSKRVEAMNMQVVSALAEAVDAKDTYTKGHSSRVAKYSKMIAARAGYSPAAQNDIYMMGLLHDVGKIGVPDEVINNPGRLTDEEYEKIKAHPVIGGKILESIKEKPKLAIGARWHHERYDGRGYPDGLSGDRIPEEARIIAVADAYDAMTSRRSYRDVMTQEKVHSEIERCSGTQFDPRFAAIMLRMIDEDKQYSMRENETHITD